MPKDKIARIRHRMDSPKAWIDLLSHANESRRGATISALEQTAVNAASGREKDRMLLKDSDKNEVLRVFLARTAVHFMPQLLEALSEIDRTLEDWGSGGPERLVEFWKSIPCVHAQMELEVSMHFEKSRNWKKGDLADLNALGMAIPCCDVVVSEKFWIHKAKQAQLHQIFGTKLLTDVCELESLLG